MRECVLLFQFEPAKQRKLVAALMTSRFRVKIVTHEEWNYPIGYLAGDKETEAEETASSEIKEEALVMPEKPMIVMAGLSRERMDVCLAAIRRSGIGPVPYKAVLTPTNRTWRAGELMRELMKEHEEMSRMEDGVKMVHEQGTQQ